MIGLDKAGARWTVTLNRADKANSLTRAMLGDLDDILAAAAGSEVAVLVITGAGKVFSAGADLDEAKAGLATDPVWERVSGRIAALDALTVAALNGTLAGGAFGMALACDLRLAVPGAKFFYPVMKLGFLPQPSDPARLAALVGPARAKLMLMGGARVSADEALSFGLVDRVVPDADLGAAVDALVADALAAAPDHRAAIKALCEGRGG
ncbi:Enoyl-CoA hydratase/carnithine racemase [Rhodovulum sp. ES.010]|uniref:enoyl-CoA hydratase/isomerase family protein n=1 Tax=Rhodovulum sp. ES.010 TaxID=1882821 RepID=UPI00092A04FF|nr:enoyl-CoA hydratase/isomerase family protein [Rhodovulum sp. ES.010]SIO48260.1 Enoyl-CoA hydratase/carnithine racemase [Rhodovulum sp. ES.010]